MLPRSSFLLLALILGFFSREVLIAAPAGSSSKKASIISLRLTAGPDEKLLRFQGADQRRQLLVTGRAEDGTVSDLTRAVSFQARPAGVVKVETNGLVIPLKDGSAVITARSPRGIQTTLSVQVEKFGTVTPINFANQIVPLFTKNGCNGGGCHGKSGGQNGFRLSLLGFEPEEDYEHLVKEARGRRIFPAAPDRSLLLQKGAAILPHGGGKRLDPASEDFRLLVRWISQGMPYGQTNDPVVERIEVFPRERTLPPMAEQQLVVLAHYSDGSKVDVTRNALYEPNDKEMARTEESGLVRLYRQPGDVAVMVRYQARVAVFRATIPLGAPVTNLPPAKNFIDQLVFQKLKRMGIPPSPPADDATFLRRVTVDLAGRFPTVVETEAFLSDPGADKRERLVARLVQSPDSAEYFASKWAALLRNKRTEGKQMRMTYAFHGWLRENLLQNKPFDKMVRDLLTASGEVEQNPPVAWFRQARETTTQLEDTAQVFLGQRLKCAECHHHPFERWSQEDYYRFAAFFSQVGRKPGARPGDELVYAKRVAPVANNKKTKQAMEPAGLGGKVLKLGRDDDAREALVDWITAPDNRFFARSVVNRYWKHFFSRGLVEPEDDMRETNPPSNPELLDALAKTFQESNYDLRKLVQTICNSQTYQLSSTPNEHNRIDKQNFSRYYPRRLTAEVLYDSVNTLLGAESKFDGLPAGTRAVQLPDNSFNASSYFLSVFGRPEMSSSCECERSQDANLAQSLHLLNSKELQEKLTRDGGRAALLAAETNRSDAEKLQELYLSAYARRPDPAELESAKKHLARLGAGEKPNPRQAYEDLLWAFMNTKEFLFNH